MSAPERSFFEELSRRRVVRVLGMYVAGAFALLQLADVTFEPLGLPDWVMRALIIALAIGFPVTAILSWVFDLTPEGLVRTGTPAAGEIDRLRTWRKVDALIIVALLLLSTTLLTRGVFSPATDKHALGLSADHSLAVLPFATIGAQPGGEYFADGLSVELINTLSMIPDLRVLSANSSLSLNAKMSDQEIGETLNVAHVVKGSVRRAGEQVRVNVNVTRVADNTVIWTKNFENSLQDVFALQDKISRGIATRLKSTLYAQVLMKMAQARTRSVEAYNEYLLALHYRRVFSWASALEHAKRSLELDPQFTAAYALAARCYLTRVRGTMPASRAYPEARRLAGMALAIEPDYGLAVTVMAHLARIDGDFAEAERLFRKARALNPGIVNQDLANLLLALGRTEEALEEYRYSYELDPLGTSFYVAALLDAGDYTEADRVTNGRIALVSEAQIPVEQVDKTRILLKLGRLEDANKMMDRVLPQLQTMPSSIQGRAALALAELGREQEARDILATLEARSEKRYVSPAGPFWASLGLGDVDRAFHWLDKVVEENVYLVIIGLQTSALYDPLRADPRFNIALQRLGLLNQPAAEPPSSNPLTGPA